MAADHGGALAERRGPAELVAEALARKPDPTLAARSDPWVLDHKLREQMAEHEMVLATRPPDCREALVAVAKELQAAESRLAGTGAVASETARRLEAVGPFAGLSRRGRGERRVAQERLTSDTERATVARDRRDEVAFRLAECRHGQEAFEHFEAAEGWRREEIPRLQEQLDHHWADVVTACARADDPLAYGVDKLRRARFTLAADLRGLDDAVRPDRGAQLDDAARRLREALRDRHDAEQALADCRAKLQDASRRRWGRRDRAAVASAEGQLVCAEERLEQGVAAESDLRGRVAAITRWQQARREAISGTAPERKELETALAQLDAGLDYTRADRVVALADEPPQYLVEQLGPPPGSSAGRAVWCHYALGVEATLDRGDGASPPSTGWTQQTQAARAAITIADRLLETSCAAGPREWASLAHEAAVLREDACRTAAVRQAAQRLLTARAGRSQWSRPGLQGWAAEEGREPSL